jgi:hypothetical protein
MLSLRDLRVHHQINVTPSTSLSSASSSSIITIWERRWVNEHGHMLHAITDA